MSLKKIMSEKKNYKNLGVILQGWGHWCVLSLQEPTLKGRLQELLLSLKSLLQVRSVSNLILSQELENLVKF